MKILSGFNLTVRKVISLYVGELWLEETLAPLPPHDFCSWTLIISLPDPFYHILPGFQIEQSLLFALLCILQRKWYMCLKHTPDHLSTLRWALQWGVFQEFGSQITLQEGNLTIDTNDQTVKIQIAPGWAWLHCNLIEYIHWFMENASHGSWKRKVKETNSNCWGHLVLWSHGRIISAVELTAATFPKTPQWHHLVHSHVPFPCFFWLTCTDLGITSSRKSF